jgi:Leucine Rich repeat
MKVIIKNPMFYLKAFSYGIVFFCINLFTLASSNIIEVQEEFSNALMHVNFSELKPEIREKLMRAYELSLIKKSQLKKTESVALFVSEGRGVKVEKEEETETVLGLWQNDLKLAVGRVKSYFKGYPPTYGSGVLIDPHHVLTLASCVLNGSLPPKHVTFFSYCSQTQQHTSSQEVCSIRVPSNYTNSLTEKKQPNNYILLTLKEGISSLGENWTFPFINYIKIPPHIQYELYSFKQDLPYIDKFYVELNKDNDEQFFVYKSSTPLGSGGAPLVILDNDRYFLAGLHLGINLLSSKKKIALKFTPQIQQSIRRMIIEEQDFQRMASNQQEIFHLGNRKQGPLAGQLEFFKELDCQGYTLTQSQLREIMDALETNPQLLTLNLSKTGLDDEAAVILAAYLSNPKNNLTVLNLSHNHLSDDGVECLMEAIQINPNILSIDISGNRLQDFDKMRLTTLLRYHEEESKNKRQILTQAIKEKHSFEKIKELIKVKNSQDLKKVAYQLCIDLDFLEPIFKETADTKAKLLENTDSCKETTFNK